ncbi:MAG: hypothetical protein JNM21_15875 [Taibaiella sp.]|nr:hypothetical protein [Taibaiella sp.]
MPANDAYKAAAKFANGSSIKRYLFDISNQDFAFSTSLPLTMQSFNVQQEDKPAAVLLWKTNGAINTVGFDIEMARKTVIFICWIM